MIPLFDEEDYLLELLIRRYLCTDLVLISAVVQP